MHSEVDVQWLTDPLAQHRDAGHDFETGAHRALCIVFMGLWIPKVDQKPVADVFGDVAVESPNELLADFLIGT